MISITHVVLPTVISSKIECDGDFANYQKFDNLTKDVYSKEEFISNINEFIEKESERLIKEKEITEEEILFLKEFNRQLLDNNFDYQIKIKEWGRITKGINNQGVLSNISMSIAYHTTEMYSSGAFPGFDENDQNSLFFWGAAGDIIGAWGGAIGYVIEHQGDGSIDNDPQFGINMGRRALGSAITASALRVGY